jgi:hypothetical protein
MRQLNLVLVVLSLLPDSRLAAEEWLGLENDQPVLIGIDLGEDEVGDSSRALLLSLPLGDRMGYYGYYSETQLTDLEQEFDNLLLLTSIWVQLSELVEFEIQHLFEAVAHSSRGRRHAVVYARRRFGFFRYPRATKFYYRRLGHRCIAGLAESNLVLAGELSKLRLRKRPERVEQKPVCQLYRQVLDPGA